MSAERASEIMGNEVEWTASRLWASLGSGMDSPFCFFFGCGSTRDDDRCLERTGTGVVVRVGAVGKVIVVVDTGVGVGPGSVIRLAVRDVPVVRIDVLIGGELVDAGRRNGSGFKTMWEGMPPCDTKVGGPSDVGRGTKVCRPLVFGRLAGGGASSYSMEGSKKGKSPAR